jgi:threonine aldolase
MRFLAAPWVGLLKGGAWLKHARHSNACAQRLAGLLRGVPGVEVLHAVEANAVFAKLPEKVVKNLETRGWHMYSFIGEGGARLMSSWQTTDADIDALLTDIRSAADPR